MHQFTDNLYNFRDLGGLRLRDGGETKHGVFARSNIILDITPEETEALKQMGFTAIVDLRTAAELEKYPHKLREHPDFTYIHSKCDDWWRDPFYTVEEAAMYYIMLLLHRDNVRAILTHLADIEGGAMFNCHAGKDRTGVTSALLLLIAGVKDEDIISDYAKTYTAKYDGTVPLEELWKSKRLVPLPENMEMFLAMLRARWGNVEGYCRYIDLPYDKVLSIRRKLTGKA